MKTIIALFVLILSMSAFAGFEGLDQGRSLKLFNRLNCTEGLECSRFKDMFIIQTKKTVEQNTAVAGSLTAEACGTTLVNSGAVAVTLPTPVVGCKITFITGDASNFDIDPGAASILTLTDSAGDSIRNATLGNSITLQAISSTQWVAVAIHGTYTDID